MLRIAEIIFRYQRPYLEDGVRALKPLRMQEVADEAGVHISTVSRAVSGKYAQTPRGIKALKFFFTSGTAKSSGEVTSQVSIKQRLRDQTGSYDATLLCFAGGLLLAALLLVGLRVATEPDDTEIAAAAPESGILRGSATGVE